MEVVFAVASLPWAPAVHSKVFDLQLMHFLFEALFKMVPTTAETACFVVVRSADCTPAGHVRSTVLDEQVRATGAVELHATQSPLLFLKNPLRQ